jgi:O-antigen/teichoic acid export membrane protein
LLTANGNLKELNWMALGGMVICVLLNLALIPHYKAIGCAVSSLITQTITALIQVYLAVKIFKFSIKKKLIIQFIIFFSGIILLGFVFKNIHISWHYTLLLLLATSFLYAMITRLLNIRSIYQVIKAGGE